MPAQRGWTDCRAPRPARDGESPFPFPFRALSSLPTGRPIHEKAGATSPTIFSPRFLDANDEAIVCLHCDVCVLRLRRE